MPTNKRTWIWIVFSIVNFQFSIVLLSCVKDTLHDTPHPDRGAVMVTTDWTAFPADAAVPASYILRLGTREQAVTDATNVLDTLLAPGRQYLHCLGECLGGRHAGGNTRLPFLGNGRTARRRG